jgi:hypothetical protein
LNEPAENGLFSLTVPVVICPGIYYMSNPQPKTSNCFTCGKEISFSARYPERLCEECMKTAVNQKGEKLSFYNEALSGGFISFNESTQTEGQEHICYVKGYECYANEAYMGGIVLVPTDQGKEKKIKKQNQNRKIRNLATLISAILGPAAIWGAYAISRRGYFNIGFTLLDVLMITGSISIFLFVCLALYRYKIFLWLTALLYAVTGYYTVYYYGYRNDAFLNAVAIIGTASAVLLINYLLFSTGYIGKKMQTFQQRKQTGSAVWILWVIIPVLLLITGHIFLSVKGDERVEQLIETAPTATTLATVKEVREYKPITRHRRDTRHNDALLQYTVNGDTLYRILDNRNTKYTTGSTLEVKYVVAEPYMVREMK